MSNTKPGAVIIEGHVQGLSNTRSLGKAGIPVYVVDKANCIARHSKYCKKYVRCPDYDKDEFADFLVDLAENEKIHGWVLIPSNDHAVYTISKHKVKLERYYRIITPGLDIVENIYDKYKLLATAKQNNIPIPVTQYLKSADNAVGRKLVYPVVMKGRYGLTFYRIMGKKVLLAKNDNELHSQLNYINDKYKIEEIIIQEMIPFNGDNHTISFTAFCVDGEIQTYWMGVKLREHPARFGTATFAKSIYQEECLQHSIPLLKSLNYTGVCEVEYILDPRDKVYKLIEINARTWLWVGLARVCGVDYALYIYKYLNDARLVCPKSYTKEVKWINFFTDIPFSVMEILKGNISLKTYLKSFEGKIVHDIFDGKDVKPFLAYIFLLPFIILKR